MPAMGLGSGAMQDQVVIRDAVPDDAETVEALVTLTARHEGMPIPNFGAQAFRRDGFGTGRVFMPVVADIQDRAVAYMLLVWSYDVQLAQRGIWICQMGVDPAHQRRGIGQMLEAEAARRAAQAGGVYVTLTVWHGNDAASAFYESLGAREDGSNTYVFDDQVFEALTVPG